ncbi:MAG TPA: hypothetical protein VF192_12350 [Longimicrobiales bacterium]
MDHGLMTGMFWGGVLLMAVPVLAGLTLGGFLLYRYLAGRGSGPGERAGRS